MHTSELMNFYNGLPNKSIYRVVPWLKKIELIDQWTSEKVFLSKFEALPNKIILFFSVVH